MVKHDPTDENGYCPVCGPRSFGVSGPWFHEQHLLADNALVKSNETENDDCCLDPSAEAQDHSGRCDA
jgi:hypothetical protein